MRLVAPTVRVVMAYRTQHIEDVQAAGIGSAADHCPVTSTSSAPLVAKLVDPMKPALTAARCPWVVVVGLGDTGRRRGRAARPTSS